MTNFKEFINEASPEVFDMIRSINYEWKHESEGLSKNIKFYESITKIFDNNIVSFQPGRGKPKRLNIWKGPSGLGFVIAFNGGFMKQGQIKKGNSWIDQLVCDDESVLEEIKSKLIKLDIITLKLKAWREPEDGAIIFVTSKCKDEWDKKYDGFINSEDKLRKDLFEYIKTITDGMEFQNEKEGWPKLSKYAFHISSPEEFNEHWFFRKLKRLADDGHKYVSCIKEESTGGYSGADLNYNFTISLKDYKGTLPKITYFI